MKPSKTLELLCPLIPNEGLEDQTGGFWSIGFLTFMISDSHLVE
jgi:hypothetical protein